MRTGIADCLAHAGRWDGVFQGNLLIGFRRRERLCSATIGKTGLVRKQVVELSKDIAYMMTGLQRLQLIRDIVVISYADGSIDQQEMDCLIWLCENVGVNPRFIQQILTSAARGVD